MGDRLSGKENEGVKLVRTVRKSVNALEEHRARAIWDEL